MNRPTRQQAIGLCLLLLIGSSEGMRVNNSISLNNDVNESAAAIQSHVAKQMSALQAKNAANEDAKWKVGWFRNFNRSACPADMSIDKIEKRFAAKSKELQTTANAVASSPLLAGKGLGMVKELVMRAKGLQLCSAAEKARPELKDLVENPDSGVRAQLAQVHQTFAAMFNKSGVVSWSPDLAIGCTMDLKVVDSSNEKGADVLKAFQKSFYGERCDVAAYQAKQPAKSRGILESFDEKFKKVGVEAASGESVDEIIEELVDEAKQSNDDVDASSLMELGDGANEEALRSFILTFIIVVIVIFAILALIACYQGGALPTAFY